jgi:gliding motility associated protien GldN
MKKNIFKSFFFLLLIAFNAKLMAGQTAKVDFGKEQGSIVNVLTDDSTKDNKDTSATATQASGFNKPVPASKRLNGVYERTIYKEKGIIPYDYVREADIFWQKRIWRVIDVREKMNLPFKYQYHFPNETFFDVIHRAVLNGDVQAFDDEDFINPLTIDKVKTIGAGVDTVQITDVNTGEVTGTEPKVRELDVNKIYQYRIKEDWFFDEETSTMKVRILGIAPILDKSSSGNSLLIPMYWVYYPDMRKIFSKKEIFNPQNDAVRMTWEDILEFRYFSSYIIKVSNVNDERIADYANGVDALLESDKIKNDIFTFEHDLWSY